FLCNASSSLSLDKVRDFSRHTSINVRFTSRDALTNCRGISPVSSPRLRQPGRRRGRAGINMRTTLAVALALALPACDGSSSPNNPTPTPATPTWTLSGSVISLENVDIAINGATVTVLDGPSANRSAMTDADGRFTLANLQQGGFTVRVSANGYQSVSRGITLTRNTFMDFGLRPDPRAILIVERPPPDDPLPP